MDSQPAEDASEGVKLFWKKFKKDYLIGIGLLLIVVLLWTSSNFITQNLYEEGYNKSFLVTYLNTSAFTLYLVPWYVRESLRRKNKSTSNPVGQGYEALSTSDAAEAPATAVASTIRASSVFSEDRRRVEDLTPLTTEETAKLAGVFCIFWFIANWSVNASLEYTSVASSTVLSSTSGFFTLLVGRVFKVETLTLAKVCAVATSFFGVLLVSLSDYSSSNLSVLPSDAPLLGAQEKFAVLGDFFALLSAIFYALYVVLLKVRIKEESRVDMQLFFGFVGAFNVILLWPVALLLHATGAEVLQLPPSHAAWAVIFTNMFITLSSDYLYVLAMLKTTPLVVTVGLSLTIPLAIIGDFFLKIPSAPQALLGAVFVLGAFIAIGMADSKADITTDKQDGVVENEEIEVDNVESAAVHT